LKEKNPFEAKQDCALYKSTLISIESLEENEFVANLTKNIVPRAKNLLIGARRTGLGILDFEWENGDPFLYSNWKINQPYNHEEELSYLRALYSDYKNFPNRPWVYMSLSTGLWFEDYLGIQNYILKTDFISICEYIIFHYYISLHFI
jgi:hypothetical protein